jgi:hypothetical protein
MMHHPSITGNLWERYRVVRLLLGAGCRIVIALDEIPPEVQKWPLEEQAELREKRPEYFPIQKLVVPAGATLSPGGLRNLTVVNEIRHLQFWGWTFAPEECGFLAGLKRLEILEIIGNGFGDSHCLEMPRMDQLYRLDLYTSGISEIGRSALTSHLPATRINYGEPVSKDDLIGPH